MIVITNTFVQVLNDWLSGKDLSRTSGHKSKINTVETWTVPQWTQEVQATVALAPGPGRGLEIGALAQLRHVGPLGYIAANSHTLKELLHTYILLEKWFYGESIATMTVTDTEFEIAWAQSAVGDIDRFVEQIHTVAMFTVLCEACPAAAHPTRVEIINPELGERDLYEAAFGCPVEFSQSTFRLVFPLEALAAPVDTGSTAMADAWRTRQRTLRETQPLATQFVHAVQEAILSHLPEGAPADLVAESLNLSRRTLQRRLFEAGCNYRQLLDGIRERHVNNLLDDPQLSLKEIAFLLGYAEQSSFNHAYLRWKKTAPLQAQAQT